MSKNKPKTMKPIIENDVVQVVESDDDSMEATRKPIVIEKKPMSEAKAKALEKARLVRTQNRNDEKVKRESQKQAISQIYQKEVEQDLKKSFLPKYEKQIKKQILTRLKDEKLKEMKAHYGIQDQEEYEEQSDDESSEEEEVVYTKRKVIKKKPTPQPPQPPASISKPTRQQPPPTPSARPRSISDLYSHFGF